MALRIPASLRLKDLKSLAFKCGIASSGTKPVLTQRLQNEIQFTSKVVAKGTRILSIDMGIRNLAYCILNVPPKSAVRAVPVTSLDASDNDGVKIVKEGIAPSIKAWHRLAVSTAPEEIDGTKAKEAFDPATLSKIAYILLKDRLLLEKPTHILIERQRFRSMGSKHILEWTIRVNMFESILYGVLVTLKNEGIWDGDVVPILPGRVLPYWLGENVDEEEVILKKERTAKSSKAQNKGLKMDLVRRWLEAGDVVDLENDAVKDMARQYMEKWDRAPGARKGRKKGEAPSLDMGKLDDLADCLLQGMAWLSWEQNKKALLKYGVGALVDLPEEELKPKPKSKPRTRKLSATSA